MSATTRREFLRQAVLTGGAAGAATLLPRAIQRAAAIAPTPGSTCLDAEHVVILMQENRSFDHAFGSLRGVRGFNDPRALRLANGDPVWVQTDEHGRRAAPFRLDLKDSRATWMGCLPHNWTDQTDARHGGLYDRWLATKRSGEPAYADMPLTMGYYTREDIPFYYELADAFTICDQHFCSTLTGTTPNRLHLWTGTIRPRQSPESPAHVLNSDCEFGAEVAWPTFPELLEDAGVSWKIYQNELTVPSGLSTEQDQWVANFGDNPIEWFTQYRVKFAPSRRRFMDDLARTLPSEIAALQRKLEQAGFAEATRSALHTELADKQRQLAAVEAERTAYSEAAWQKLSPRERRLHERAFVTNSGDPDYRTLMELQYSEGRTERRFSVPKGDLLHQFRADVERGSLPAVSWIVAPERFSDHPCSPWYGAWYIAETLDALTQNPDVWRKTIFLLTYDENDGYFDHVPPFVAAHPRRPETGRASPGVRLDLEYVEREQELKYKAAAECRDSPLGLGYRVPLVIASPWSRGGRVCSQVFDHTSSLQFLEKWTAHKFGRKIQCVNINTWRRTVCGDLTSAFEDAASAELAVPPVPPRDEFLQGIHRSQFRPLPTMAAPLSGDDLARLRDEGAATGLLPQQEPGVRPSNSLPYELVVDGRLDHKSGRFVVSLAALRDQFGDRAAGAPFIVYARHGTGSMQVRNYAVAAGDRLEDEWPLPDFPDGKYWLEVHGPNGFFREFRGELDEPRVSVELHELRSPVDSGRRSGDVEFRLQNLDAARSCTVEIRDRGYDREAECLTVAPGATAVAPVSSHRNFGWYDVEIQVAAAANRLSKRYAGRVETGTAGYSDPAMGRLRA